MRRGTRAAIVTGLASLVLGCGTNSDQARYASLAWRLVSGQRGEVAREQASAIPFASLGVAIGRNDEGLMVLGLAEGAFQRRLIAHVATDDFYVIEQPAAHQLALRHPVAHEAKDVGACLH